MKAIAGICLILAGLALAVGTCSGTNPTSTGTPSEAPAWAGSLLAYPISGRESLISIAGTVGSVAGDTLLGADTPYGHAYLTATSACIGGGTITMPAWRIEPHGSISLVLGSGYLMVAKASGLPEPGTDMPVVLHFSAAGDVTVMAAVQPVEHDESSPQPDAGCGG